MQEKLRELIAHCKNTGMTNGKWFAGELEAALAAAPQPDFHKLTEDIFNLLGKWNDTFLAGRDALESKLHEWIGNGPAVVKYDTCCDQAGTVHFHAVAAALAAAPQPEQIIEIDEDGKVYYPPCACFTCPQHGPLLKAIEQRESLAREHK